MRLARYAASVSDHSYDDDAAMTVVRLAKELVGEGAYGRAWIDRTLAQPVLGVHGLEADGSLPPEGRAIDDIIGKLMFY